MGAGFSKIRIENNKNFVTDVMGNGAFETDRYVYGDIGMKWAAIDPEKYPLYVWEKDKKLPPPGYVETAHKLDAIAFSNGPLMTNMAEPYGPVKSVKNKISDAGAKNKLDKWMYGLGRKSPGASGVKFSDYAVFPSLDKAGQTTALKPYDEAISGLYPLIIGGSLCSKDPTDAQHYNESYKNFMDNSVQIVAWGLLPASGDATPLIVVAGREEKIQGVVDAFVTIGVHDAVAMDGGTYDTVVRTGSGMIGEHDTSWFDPAEGIVGKQTQQKYGFYCK